MLKLKLLNLSMVILLITISIPSLLMAQETVEQRRAREHQAVLDFMNNKLATTPVNTTVPDMSVDKYALTNKLTKRLGKSNAFEDRKR
ncbi:MAG TPA: hypothetical protein VK870_00920, partial [Ignavibacteriaceae bacterium]|nr:hypothetical protein [Ignavibacteriaceae bacterium]